MTARKELGRLQKTFPGQSINWIDFFLWILPGVLLSLGLMFYGVYLRTIGYTQSVLRPAGWFLLAVLAFLPSGILILRRFFSSRKAVRVHENGIVLIHINSPHQTLFWRQINGLRSHGSRYHFLGLPITDRLAITIEPVHGRELVIPGAITNISVLSELIKSKIYPILFPSLNTDFHEGQTLQFGPIQVNKDQVLIGRRIIPWQEVREMVVNSGTLIIRNEKSRPLRMPAGTIPNIELFLQLLDQHFSTKN